MELTLLLSKLFGLYMFLAGLSMMLNKTDWKAYLGELGKHRHFSMVAAIIALIIGGLIVSEHNIWTGGFDVVVITVLGWLSLLKGVMLFLLPHKTFVGLSQSMMKNGYKLWSVIILLLGLYLLLSGFMVI